MAIIFLVISSIDRPIAQCGWCVQSSREFRPTLVHVVNAKPNPNPHRRTRREGREHMSPPKKNRNIFVGQLLRKIRAFSYFRTPPPKKKNQPWQIWHSKYAKFLPFSAQNTAPGHRRRSSINFGGNTFFSRKLRMKINKMPEFCVIAYLSKCRNFYSSRHAGRRQRVE